MGRLGPKSTAVEFTLPRCLTARVTDVRFAHYGASPGKPVRGGIDLARPTRRSPLSILKRPSRASPRFASRSLLRPAWWKARDTLPSFHYQRQMAVRSRRVSNFPGRAMSPLTPSACWPAIKAPSLRVADRLGQVVALPRGDRPHGGPVAVAGSPDVERHSPTKTSARICRHVLELGTFRSPAEPLEEAGRDLTLPASFDEVARELTVKAAAAGRAAARDLIESAKQRSTLDPEPGDDGSDRQPGKRSWSAT